MSITKTPFGTDLIGREMTLYTMTNSSGASASVLDYGAHLTSIRVPDRDGKNADVVLGYDTLREYDENPSYLGAAIGRYGNRIGGARFTLNGKEYTLFKNDGENSLHGGREGFDKKWFRGETMEGGTEDAVIFTYVAHDGEEGYPGKLHLQVSYAWDEHNTLTIRYLACSDQDTVLNLTNHAYYNLRGEGNGDILDHELALRSLLITDVDKGLIPTGEFTMVKDTALDFSTAPRTVRDAVNRSGSCPLVAQVNGLDFNFCVSGEGMREHAVLFDPESGREMTVRSTEPGIQIYTGQGLNLKGKGGKKYGSFAGVAMETQHYPDSPNHPSFPTTTLRAGDTYSSATQYAFSVRK